MIVGTDIRAGGGSGSKWASGVIESRGVGEDNRGEMI